jgi:hypothetical protein
MLVVIEDCVFEIVSKNIMSLSPDYKRCGEKLRCKKTVPAGDQFFTADFGLDPSCRKDIKMIAYGILRYKGIGGTSHSSGFALEISINEKKFSMFNSDRYNYYT